MINFLKKKFNKNLKYGSLFFTFPNGEKLYLLNESEFESIQNTKLIHIQENANYIAHLGVSKSTLQNAVSRLKMIQYEILALSEMKDKSKLREKIQESITSISFIDNTQREYDEISDIIMLSMFDLFFYFDGENPFIKSFEMLEKKKYMLAQYPQFRHFFFQKLNNYITASKITYQNAIHFALIQTQIQEVVKDLQYTTISDSEIG